MNVIMDVKTHVPHLPVTVDENYINEGALKILEIIRPKWKKGGIQFKVCISKLFYKAFKEKLFYKIEVQDKFIN